MRCEWRKKAQHTMEREEERLGTHCTHPILEVLTTRRRTPKIFEKSIEADGSSDGCGRIGDWGSGEAPSPLTSAFCIIILNYSPSRCRRAGVRLCSTTTDGSHFIRANYGNRVMSRRERGEKASNTLPSLPSWPRPGEMTAILGPHLLAPSPSSSSSDNPIDFLSGTLAASSMGWLDSGAGREVHPYATSAGRAVATACLSVGLTVWRLWPLDRGSAVPPPVHPSGVMYPL